MGIFGCHKLYYIDYDTRMVCMQLMALPLLPMQFIVRQFFRLKEICINSGVKSLIDLVEYMHNTWISGKIWSPADWVQFREFDRTNIYSEGYHSGLHTRVRQANNQLFVLINKLFDEAKSIDLFYLSSIILFKKDAKYNL